MRFIIHATTKLISIYLNPSTFKDKKLHHSSLDIVKLGLDFKLHIMAEDQNTFASSHLVENKTIIATVMAYSIEQQNLC